MKRMRSVSAFIVTAALLAIAVSVLAGCAGGSTSQAKEFLEKADGLYNVATGIGLQLDDLKSEIERLMVANDVAGLVAKRPAVEDMLKKIDRSMGLLEQAIPEYQKVTRLSGVDKYKQYASGPSHI
jgi:hypothetical protein